MSEGMPKQASAETSKESGDETVDAATVRVNSQLQAVLDDIARGENHRVGIWVKLKNGVTDAAHADRPITIDNGRIHFQSFARGGGYPVSIDVREVEGLENRGY